MAEWGTDWFRVVDSSSFAQFLAAAFGGVETHVRLCVLVEVVYGVASREQRAWMRNELSCGRTSERMHTAKRLRRVAYHVTGHFSQEQLAAITLATRMRVAADEIAGIVVRGGPWIPAE